MGHFVVSGFTRYSFWNEMYTNIVAEFLQVAKFFSPIVISNERSRSQRKYLRCLKFKAFGKRNLPKSHFAPTKNVLLDEGSVRGCKKYIV